MKPDGSMMKPVPAPCGTSSTAPEGGALLEGCEVPGRACTRFSTSTVAGRTFAATLVTSGSVPEEVAAGVSVAAPGLGEVTTEPVAAAPIAGAVAASPCGTTLWMGAAAVGATAPVLGAVAVDASAVAAALGAGAVVAVLLAPPTLHPARARIAIRLSNMVRQTCLRMGYSFSLPKVGTDHGDRIPGP